MLAELVAGATTQVRSAAMGALMMITTVDAGEPFVLGNTIRSESLDRPHSAHSLEHISRDLAHPGRRGIQFPLVCPALPPLRNMQLRASPPCSFASSPLLLPLLVRRLPPLAPRSPTTRPSGKRAILSTTAAEEAVRALGERDDVLLLNALKLIASIAAHPGKTEF